MNQSWTSKPTKTGCLILIAIGHTSVKNAITMWFTCMIEKAAFCSVIQRALSLWLRFTCAPGVGQLGEFYRDFWPDIFGEGGLWWKSRQTSTVRRRCFGRRWRHVRGGAGSPSFSWGSSHVSMVKCRAICETVYFGEFSHPIWPNKRSISRHYE